MKILILASIGCQNLWDELILKNTIKHFEKKYAKRPLRFDICSYDPENSFLKAKNINYHEYFPNGIKKVSRLFRNFKNYKNFITLIQDADLVVIGWGGLFFDNEWSVSTLKNLNNWIFRTKILKKYNKEVCFYGVGINFQDCSNEALTKKIREIFSVASEISVRDGFSQKYLKNAWFSSEKILDPVYQDTWKYSENKTLELGYLKIEELSKNTLDRFDFLGKNIGLALRELQIPGYEKQVIELIEYLIQKKAKITLIAHSFHPDDLSSNDHIFFSQLLKKYYNEYYN